VNYYAPRGPFLTLAMIVVMILVFITELRVAGPEVGPDMSPSGQVLLTLGALQRTAVLQDGEWFRILTNVLLHATVTQLIANAIALLLAGWALERLLGHEWLWALFCVGSVSGSLMSLAINPPTRISVGASGAIMCLLATAFVTSFRIPEIGIRGRVQLRMLRILVPSMIPLLPRGGVPIDFASHLGGAASGVVMGLLLLVAWPRREPTPRFGEMAMVISGVGVLGYSVALYLASRAFVAHTASALTALIPAVQMPVTTAEGVVHSAELVAAYPHDPRARELRAIALMRVFDFTGAEEQLRAGLAEEGRQVGQFPLAFWVGLHAELAHVLLMQGRLADARDAAAPACANANAVAVPTEILAAHLCR
jgi:rhomboid protease GluP